MDLDIALRSIENDISVRYDKTIDEKSVFIKQLESELENLRLLNQSVSCEFKDKEQKYLDHISSLENLKSELVKTYNQEINQLKLLTKLNSETFLNDTSLANESKFGTIPATGGNTNESLCSNILITLNQPEEIDEDSSSSSDSTKISPTIVVSAAGDDDNSVFSRADRGNSKRLKEANDELLLELKETLEEKEKFIRELQYEIEEYKNEYENLKSKNDTSGSTSFKSQNDSILNEESAYKNLYLDLKTGLVFSILLNSLFKHSFRFIFKKLNLYLIP
jgi:hypothetical protein